LRAAFTSGEAIGVLTHHLVHDEATWIFLEQLFEHTANNTEWLGFDGLTARPSGDGAEIKPSVA
jgi:hypothetical protein